MKPSTITVSFALLLAHLQLNCGSSRTCFDTATCSVESEAGTDAQGGSTDGDGEAQPTEGGDAARTEADGGDAARTDADGGDATRTEIEGGDAETAVTEGGDEAPVGDAATDTRTDTGQVEASRSAPDADSATRDSNDAGSADSGSLEASRDGEAGTPEAGADGPSGQCGNDGEANLCRLGCASGQCICSVADGNVLRGAGFDSNLGSWSFTGTSVWSVDDAVGCSSSGSLHVTTSRAGTQADITSGDYLAYCAIPTQAVVAGTYNFGLKLRMLPGSGKALVQIVAMFRSVCGGSDSGGATTAVIPLDTYSDWTPITGQFTSSGAGNGAEFDVIIAKQGSSEPAADLEIDDVYIAPAPSVGWR